jgi:DNA polymerase-3 subunit alpha (Gram-positive type)
MAVIWDTETTGLLQPTRLAEKQPKIIEIFCLKVDDESLEEVDTLSTLINPQKSISEKITEITGITDKDVEDKPAFVSVYPKLAEFFLGEKTMVAHNLTFDRDMLHYELVRMGKDRAFPWPPEQICTVEQTMQVKGFRLKLADLYEHCFGEKFDDAHRAEADVRALYRIFKHLRGSNML